MEHSIKQLFSAYIQNRATVQEVEQVIQLIKSGGYEAEWEAAMLDAEPGVLAPDVPELDTAALYQRITKHTTPRHHLTRYRWVAYAAAVLVLLSAGILFLRPAAEIHQPVQNLAQVKPAVNPGGRKWIKLPDGTSVQLNEDSKLDYPESFDGKHLREVSLIGEAYFDVKHDARHPFVIHTGKLKTTVLGTAFNISAYPSGKTVMVTVTRGKVMVQEGKKTLAILTPDQQLKWSAATAVAEKRQVNTAAVIAWQAQDLIMDDIPLSRAAELIADRYKVKVIFKNEKVKDCRFTAAFLNRNQIGQVITVLADVTNASFELKGSTLYIDGPGCEN